MKRVKTRMRTKLSDDSLDGILCVALEGDFADLNGLPRDLIKTVVDTYVTDGSRKSTWASYDALVEAQQYVIEWRQRLLDAL